MQNYNVLFMGTSKFAVPILEGLLESSVNIQAVFSAPPKLANRGMKKTLSPVAKFAEEYQLPLEYPTSLKDPEIINKILVSPETEKDSLSKIVEIINPVFLIN